MRKLRILFVEDRDDDVALVVRELRKAGFDVEWERVEKEEAMLAALNNRTWDVVISDFSMPQFSGPAALAVLKESGLDTPFIMISGTVGEDTAVAALKGGAHDFMSKGNLRRLVPAIERELREAEGRRERRRAEQKLRESEATLQAVVTASPVALVILNAEQRVVGWNPAAERVFGWTRDEMMKRMPPFPVVEGPQEFAATRKDGKQISIVVRTSPLIDSARSGGLIAAVEDVTEQRVLEHQFRQAQKMEAVGRLAGGIAHDFNNILTAIQGYASLTLSDLQPGTQPHQDIQEILDAAQWAASFTRQLLTFSRKQVTKRVLVDPNAVVSEMRRLLHRVIGDHYDLRLDLSPEVRPIFIDGGQLEQVIMNLVVNARDAMPHGGTVVIRTERSQGQPEGTLFGTAEMPDCACSAIRVRDEGHGIPQEVLARIFEPFFTTKEAGKGTGLGLSTVYGIVTQNDGFLSVSTNEHGGSDFCVFFPERAAENGAAPRAETLNAATSPCSAQQYLIVEDETAVRRLLQRTLEREGYVVHTAADADEGLEALRANPTIDVLITDLMLPSTTGVKLISQAKEIAPHIATLLISGYSSEDVTLPPGCAFLEKPFTAAELLAALRECVEAEKGLLGSR